MVLVDADPIFRLWSIAASGPHSHHLTAKSVLEADFLSLPFIEHQSAALACGRIADRLLNTHGDDSMVTVFKFNNLDVL